MKTTRTPCALFLDITDHSSLLFSSSSSPSEEQGVEISLTLHTFISLLTLHFLCVWCGALTTEIIMHVWCAVSTEWSHNGVHESNYDEFVDNILHCTTHGTSIL